VPCKKLPTDEVCVINFVEEWRLVYGVRVESESIQVCCDVFVPNNAGEECFFGEVGRWGWESGGCHCTEFLDSVPREFGEEKRYEHQRWIYDRRRLLMSFKDYC